MAKAIIPIANGTVAVERQDNRTAKLTLKAPGELGGQHDGYLSREQAELLHAALGTLIKQLDR